MSVTFLLCFAVVLAAMGWMSATVLRLHRNELAAEQRADVEERVRLALWRMDSVIGALIARENGRSYLAYTSLYPVGRAYTADLAPLDYGAVLVPSPVLSDPSPFIRLHFAMDQAGVWTSPQIPADDVRAAALEQYTSAQRIRAASEQLDALRRLNIRPALSAALSAQTDAPQVRVPEPARQQFVGRSKTAQVQRTLNELERSYRTQQNSLLNQQLSEGNQAALPFSDVHASVMTPVWIGDVLLLARRVRINSRELVQGCWLDWPAMSADLLARTLDLLPNAQLQPVLSSAGVQDARQLATLPVRLVPGELPTTGDGASPLIVSLVVAWACFAVATIAVGALLAGALSLSERRGAFVSAVTHELRTPLTAFRLYADMLADQKDAAPGTRQRYVETLRQEAGRLQHLVENVLAYARLERGRRAAGECVPAESLLDRFRDALEQRTARAGLALTIECDAAARGVTARVDPSALERIMLNLTDNACKYASHGPRPSLHVAIRRRANQVVVRVRDHGPGVATSDLPRLFRPFHKSARDAAHSAPGVGLGLSLSRKLARDMGGDLMLDRTVCDGACFVLTLPTVDIG